MLQPRLSRTVLALIALAWALLARGGEAALAERAAGILQQRCMVCHGCYDAPCQLKLEARAGLERGATKAKVYDSTRLRAAEPTRLFDDAQSAAAWRDKGFFPVLAQGDPEAGLVYRMLALKRAHPLPASAPLPGGFDLSLYREEQCPKPDEFDAFARENPLWGMPFALPGLSEEEHSVMIDWLRAGAPAARPHPLEGKLADSVARWEALLNGPDNKTRLMSRYLYEHLFLASLYFGPENSPQIWFRLVRSRTAPGEPLDLIATRRPFDDPGVQRVYYRLQRMPTIPLAKTHMPYRLDDERLALYRELFLDADYEVDKLPSYERKLTANPFRTFAALPARSRYRFLLEEAQFTIMNFIKGPVCRGQVALNVIEDRFWVAFTDPAGIVPELDEVFLAEEMHNLRLPTPRTDTPIDLLAWKRYSRAEQRYQKARWDYLQKQFTLEQRTRGLETIWDGDGNNPNAALTIFRHFDSASVVKGFVGDVPKTAWVVGYPLLERLHYLLAANYDVFGSVSHQLESRLYMDFLRFEGENNFLLFMPEETHKALQAYWYRDAPDFVNKYMSDANLINPQELGLHYETGDPKRELLLKLRQRIYGADAAQWDYRPSTDKMTREVFEGLERNRGSHNSFLPQVSFLNVIGNQRDEVYTLLRDSGYSNIAQLFEEKERRLPEEDGLTVVRGLLGAYPNYFFVVHDGELQRFADSIAALDSPEDYSALVARWGVQRSDPWFWRVSDKLHRWQREQRPVEAGLFDFNRYHPQPPLADSPLAQTDSE